MKPHEMAAALHDVIMAIHTGQEGAEYISTTFAAGVAHQQAILVSTKSAQKAIDSYLLAADALLHQLQPIMPLIHALESE